jgi:hypothetical protein
VSNTTLHVRLYCHDARGASQRRRIFVFAIGRQPRALRGGTRSNPSVNISFLTGASTASLLICKIETFNKIFDIAIIEIGKSDTQLSYRQRQ